MTDCAPAELIPAGALRAVARRDRDETSARVALSGTPSACSAAGGWPPGASFASAWPGRLPQERRASTHFMRGRVWDCAGGSNVCRRRSAQRGARSLDTFHAGDPEIVVTGIATTVMPTFDVLKPAAAEPIAAIVRTIFAQRDHATAIAHLQKVVDGLRRGFRRA